MFSFLVLFSFINYSFECSIGKGCIGNTNFMPFQISFQIKFVDQSHCCILFVITGSPEIPKDRTHDYPLQVVPLRTKPLQNIKMMSR